MFTLLRSISLRRFFFEQVPTLLPAWLIAEFFYKFHSFSLECAAFLVTWFLFDGGLQGLRKLISDRVENKDLRLARPEIS